MRHARLLLLFCAFFPSFLFAEEQLSVPPLPIEVSASLLEHDGKNGSYVASGDVRLTQGDATLKANSIRYDERTEELLAEGDVLFSDPKIEIQCERLKLNLASKEGEIEKGRIYLKEGEYYVEGERIEKKGEKRYVISKGGITTCGFDQPAWKIVARDANVEMGGYAKVRDSSFRVVGLPVLYLPYGIFPVKTERQSGFLIPDIASSSRHGVIVRNSYFWAISQDKDLTLMLDYMGKRGPTFGAEFRYALREDLKGTLEASLLDDKKYGATRYRLQAEHEQLLPGTVRMVLQGEKVSDIDYLLDFGTSKEKREGLLKSLLFLERFFSRSLVTLEFSHFRTLLEKDNSSTFQYLPFFSLSTEFLPIKGRALFHLYSDLINFYRQQGNRYTRWTFEPSLSLPLFFKGFALTASARGYETLYLVDDREGKGERDSRRETFRIDMEGTFKLLKEHRNFRELLRPFFRYTFIPATSTRGIPFIEPYDRLQRMHTVTYGLNQELEDRTGSRSLWGLEVSQSFGVDRPLKPSSLYSGYGERFSDISLRWNFYPLSFLSLHTESSIDVYRGLLRTCKNTVVYERSDRYRIGISQNYLRDSVDELYFDVWAKHGSVEGRYEARYSFRDHVWIDSLYSIRYSHKCYRINVALVTSERPKESSIRLSLDLLGITGRR